MREHTKKELEELEKLEKALKESENKMSNQGAALKVEDISNKIEHLLTDKAKAMFATPRVRNLTTFNADGSVKWVVRYLGIRTALKSVGALKIAKIANEIAEQYQVHGVLALPSQIELVADSMLRKSDTVSLFYIALSPSDAIKIEKHQFALSEGGTPDVTLETLEELEEWKDAGLFDMDDKVEPNPLGTAHYKFRIGYNLTEKTSDHKKILEREVERLLAMLPEGTTHISTEAMQLVNLSMNYHMKFQNDIFMDDSEIKDISTYTREVVRVEGENKNDKLVCINANNSFNFDDFIKTKYEGKFMSLGEAKSLMILLKQNMKVNLCLWVRQRV